VAVSTGAPRTAAVFPPIPLHRRIYGFGSIYGKTIRDSRLSFIIAAGLLGGMALVMGVAVSSIFPTTEARHELDSLFGGIPTSLLRQADDGLYTSIRITEVLRKALRDSQDERR
jgi:hypothetical protein